MAPTKRRGVERPANPTDRTFVTLPDFVLFELNQLKGIYAPTLPEVIKWIVQDWLHDNQAEIEQRKRQFREYKVTSVD